jgi:putative two-component system response regulator
MGREIAMCHHENWDGTGYPDGLIGKEIPELARIVAVVDVYDSLVHDRVYRPAFSEETAVGIIVEGKGTKFEPEIVNCFLDALPDLRKIRHKLDTGSAGEFFPQRLEQ